MVEAKKKRKRKAKAKPRAGQIISQKVVVNVGNKGYGSKRRTGTQAKRSTQPQVVYQPAPIPLQPNYSSQLNDLRNEVRTHLSGVNLEEGRRRAIELREQHDAQMVRDELARRVAFQEGTQETAVQTERQFEPAQRRETTPPLQATQAPQVGVSLGIPVQGQRITKPEPLGAGGGGRSLSETEPRVPRHRRTKLEIQAARSQSIEPFVKSGKPKIKLTEEQKKKRDKILASAKKRSQGAAEEEIEDPDDLKRFASAEGPSFV
tara:strand:- start:64 stop:849 length:786 start_codon:yes stop_codon:yes gene_type:complete